MVIGGADACELRKFDDVDELMSPIVDGVEG